jgi:transposase
MMKSTTIAIDIAKDVFQLAVADSKLRVTENVRLNRKQFLAWFENRSVDQIVMEACGSAHHWARSFRARGGAIVPVQVKSVEQQALQGLHRIRSLWMHDRTARINTLRGLLREFGIPILVGARTGSKPRSPRSSASCPKPPGKAGPASCCFLSRALG